MTLQQVRAVAMTLAGAVEQPHFDYTSFRVDGRIFATAPPDGGHVHIFVSEQQRVLAVKLNPGWIEPLKWGKKQVGVRIRLADADATVVKALLESAWQAKSTRL